MWEHELHPMNVSFTLFGLPGLSATISFRVCASPLRSVGPHRLVVEPEPGMRINVGGFLMLWLKGPNW